MFHIGNGWSLYLSGDYRCGEPMFVLRKVEAASFAAIQDHFRLRIFVGADCLDDADPCP